MHCLLGLENKRANRLATPWLGRRQMQCKRSFPIANSAAIILATRISSLPSVKRGAEAGERPVLCRAYNEPAERRSGGNMPRVGHGPATEDSKLVDMVDRKICKVFRLLFKCPLQERRLNSGLQTLPSGLLLERPNVARCLPTGMVCELNRGIT